MGESVIQIHGLKKYFKSGVSFFGRKDKWIHAVDDINLDIQKGEIVGLVGESGSGKTTLARLILNLTCPTGGSVVINGVNAAKATR